MSLPFHEGEAEDHPFWQRRFYDFGVRALLGARSIKCMERQESEREAGLYARQSSEAQTGPAFERLALEQLVELRKGRERVDRD
jgi:hypothetical protein